MDFSWNPTVGKIIFKTLRWKYFKTEMSSSLILRWILIIPSNVSDCHDLTTLRLWRHSTSLNTFTLYISHDLKTTFTLKVECVIRLSRPFPITSINTLTLYVLWSWATSSIKVLRFIECGRGLKFEEVICYGFRIFGNVDCLRVLWFLKTWVLRSSRRSVTKIIKVLINVACHGHERLILWSWEMLSVVEC